MATVKKYYINPLRQTTERIEFYEDAAHEYRWRLIGGNGEPIAASSEGFDSEQGAIKNARLTCRKLTLILQTNELY